MVNYKGSYFEGGERMDLITQRVLREFYALCEIPHPSGGEKKISDYLMGRLRAAGLVPEQDAAFNIICDVPATAGYENKKRLALQAHMDMVCVGDADYIPETDPIQTEIREGWLCSDGRSSLGADCGIGLAAALYILLSGEYPHGPVRLILTTVEEQGMVGARQLRRDCLASCAGFINLDGFHFGELLISSAGGKRQKFTKTPELFFAVPERAVEVKISGLTGGHSGEDIGKTRANAAEILVWLLQALPFPWELASLSAGNSFNAIPASGSAVILLDPGDDSALGELIDRFSSELHGLYPGENIRIAPSETDRPDLVFTVDERDNILAMAGLLLCGEAGKHPLFPEVTGSSGSMGMLYADRERIEIRSFLRSVDAAFLQQYGDFYAAAAEGFGFSSTDDSYIPWPGAERDDLTDRFLRVGEALSLPLRKNGIHVGLETSIFHGMAPETDMVSVGMNIRDPHSVSERVELSTIAPFVSLLAGVLKEI